MNNLKVFKTIVNIGIQYMCRISNPKGTTNYHSINHILVDGTMG